MNIKDIFSYVIDFLSNRRCMICGAPLPHGRYGICIECEYETAIFDAPMLKFPGNILEERLYGLAKFETASALMKFSEDAPSRKIIHALKYHNERGIGQLLGNAMADRIIKNDKFPHFDYIVPVPLHPNRFHSRGYNQSELIASVVAKRLNTQISTDNLYRERDNKTQTLKSLTERAVNVKNLFSLHNPSIFSAKTILLIDDVFTSGATIIDCCRALNESEGIKIHIYTTAAAHVID